MGKGLLGMVTPGSAYENPGMSPEVIKALAEAGFAP